MIVDAKFLASLSCMSFIVPHLIFDEKCECKPHLFKLLVIATLQAYKKTINSWKSVFVSHSGSNWRKGNRPLFRFQSLWREQCLTEKDIFLLPELKAKIWTKCKHKLSQGSLISNLSTAFFCCCDPLGGRNYTLKWVFFVQSILTDRYIHHTELWVVTLKSTSSLEYEIKKIFLNFVFYRELSRFEVLRMVDEFLSPLLTLSGISHKISSILLKIVKIVNNSTVYFVFKETKKVLLTILILFFRLKFWLRTSILSLFHQKLSQIRFFSPIWLNLLKVHTPKTTNTIFVNYKES